MGILLWLISQPTQADPKSLISITFLIEKSYSWFFNSNPAFFKSLSFRQSETLILDIKGRL